MNGNTLLRRILQTIIGAGLLIVGPVASIGTWSNISEGRAAAAWPTAEATIKTSKVEVAHYNKSASYECVVTYDFVVDKQKFSGSRINVGNARGTQATAQADAARYAPGTKHAVHYDPADPANNVLEPGASTGLFVFAIIVGPCITLFGLAVLGLAVINWLSAMEANAESEDAEEEEEAPRVKRKVRPVADDDEDEAPRPKRKVRPAPDDYNGSPRPRKPIRDDVSRPKPPRKLEQ